MLRTPAIMGSAAVHVLAGVGTYFGAMGSAAAAGLAEEAVAQPPVRDTIN